MIEKRGRPVVYHTLTYEELGEYIGAKGVVPVKKNWLESIGFIFEDAPQDSPRPNSPSKEESSQIKYSITRFDNE